MFSAEGSVGQDASVCTVYMIKGVFKATINTHVSSSLTPAAQ